MSEIVEYLRRGAASVTPRIVQQALPSFPMWKMEFTQIDAPRFPRLAEQLDFLVTVVEDFAEGAAPDIPYTTVAEAMFAITYAHKQVDLIPDTIPDIGFSDDASIVKAVLIRHERPLAAYAMAQGIDWMQLSR